MSIKVEHINKSFGDFVALDDVSLTFPTGSLVSLLGPSGCGKTTLLRIIAGLETADSGKVFLEDEDATDQHVRARNVGFVFQHYALFRHMTIFDNVAFGLRMRPRKTRPSEQAIRDKVLGLLELVQLGWVADRFPSQLSGGQRQRIALVRALAVEPRVLLLDEPFGALDAKVRKELRRWLRKLHDDLHITSIFVTHDQEEALEVANQVVLINKGRVEQVGTPEEVYHHPASPFVCSFIGTANQFHARDDGLAYARPHEIEILPDPHVEEGVPARINRVLSFGLTTRVELSGLNGSSGLIFDVELLRDKAEKLGLNEGQDVRLVPSDLCLFKAADI